MTERYNFKIRVALVIAGMTSAFLVVFTITFLAINAVREGKKVTVSPDNLHPPFPKDIVTASDTLEPTDARTFFPSYSPKLSSTDAPTLSPTNSFTDTTTSFPTDAPTISPTHSPTDTPASFPTDAPTSHPTNVPTSSPTDAPTTPPTDSPTSSLAITTKKEWKQTGQTILGKPMEDLYGQPVAMSSDGNRVVLGAPWDDNLGGGISTVHIYDFDSSNFWKEVGRISGNNEDLFGWTMALSGDGRRLAIGAMGEDSGSGTVQVYEYTGIVQDNSDIQADPDNWNKVGNTIVGLASGSGWGQSIAISEDGNRLVIKGGSSGSDNTDVRVFELNKYKLKQDIWTEIAKISKVIEFDSNDYGYNVDISANGKIIAIGSQYNDDDKNDGGYVQIFAESNDRRTQSIPESLQMKDYTNEADIPEAKYLMDYRPDPWLQVGDAILEELPDVAFAYSISMNALGNMIAVGSSSIDFGQVRVFEYVDKDWIQMGQTLVGSDRSFGECVALAPHSNQLGIASTNNDGGAVYIYEYDDGKWVQLGSTIFGQMSDEFFGISLSLSSSGNRVAIGSVYYDQSVNGQLQVYEYM